MQQSPQKTTFIKPMLASETADPFDDEGWIFEMKWDGFRAICEKKDGTVSLYSRNGISFNAAYPIVVSQLESLTGNVVLDGEITVLDEQGIPNFQYLQAYAENQHRPIQYQVFDILKLEGKDLTRLPLLQRKELLREWLVDNPVIRYSDHIAARGNDFFQLTGERHLEGIMAKKADSEYTLGKRSRDWLKIKHHKTGEAIIAGYTAPSGSRKYFGSLVLGAYQGDEFVHVGNAGTGFNDARLKELTDLFQPLIQKTSPFDHKIPAANSITWLSPEIVCEIKYAEITADGKFRHPVFLHLRMDKNVKEITMDNSSEKKSAAKKSSSATTRAKAAPKKTAPAKTPSKSKKKNVSKLKDGSLEYTFGNTQVAISNPDKVYFPEDEFTKGDVVAYYQDIADIILPYLKGRPESLLRHPNGIHEQSFFHKDAGVHAPEFVDRVQVHSEFTDKEIDYIICNNAATLAYLNNLRCIEINPWPATEENLDNPDYIIIDIDPSEKNTFDDVVEAALAVKQVLDKAGAEGYCKTSGASGLHIYIPAGKKYSFEQAKDFAHIICTIVQGMLPDLTTLERSLTKRPKNKIYMDYLQNRRGQTLASVYSLRPREGLTVSTPLQWKEVKKGITPKQYTVHNIRQRIKKHGDLFSDVLGKGLDLESCLEKLGQ